MARRRVSDVLEAVNFDSVLAVLLTRSELADRMLELRHRLRQEVSQLNRRSGYCHDLVKVHRVGDLFDVVENVVETGRKGGDVLVVEGGDEGLVEEDARADEYRSLLFEEVVEALLSGDER